MILSDYSRFWFLWSVPSVVKGFEIMPLKTVLLGFAALMLTATAAYSQSAETVLARYNQDPQLAAVVADEVANDPQAAGAFYAAVIDESETAQIYVGAGFASAYQVLIEAGDSTGAGIVLQVVCSGGGAGSLASSFAASLGGSIVAICSGSGSGDYSGTAPSLFRINANGGGNGISRN